MPYAVSPLAYTLNGNSARDETVMRILNMRMAAVQRTTFGSSELSIARRAAVIIVVTVPIQHHGCDRQDRQTP